MSKLEIASLNVRGLQDNNKRKRIFQTFRNSKFDIILLQETHSTDEDVILWKKDWIGRAFFSSLNSTKSGVAILCKESKNFKVEFENSDKAGRIISVTVETQKNKFQITNIYAPNIPLQRKTFFDKLKGYVTPKYEVILGGDFNMVENLTMDRQGGNPNRQHLYGLEELNEIKQNCNLTDIWRTQNKFKMKFTYENGILDFKSRIDRFYMWNQAEKQFSIRSDIIQNKLSDHHMITLSLKNITTNKRGPSYWKLNTSILENKDYKQKIETFWINWKNKKNIYPDQTKWWDMAKQYIQGITKDFCIDFKQNQNELLVEYRAEIDSLYQQRPIDHEKINEIQNNIDIIEERSLKGAMVRSRTKFIENEETPSKFFYAAESVFQKNKTITALKDKSGKIVTTDKEILKSAQTFYEELYKKAQINKSEQDKLINNYEKKISDNWHNKLKENFTEKEIYNSLKDMSEDSAPGKDGIPMEFYRTFWYLIKEDFTNLVNYIFFEKQEITKTMKTAIISLIPKTTPEETNIAKWRPISLLCVDYKIITKTITNRLLPTLSEIISSEQSAAVPGRHIYDNLFTIRDLINYSNKKHIPTYILSFDQEKAFDKVDRDYMFRCLERMNYPQQFVEFIRILYCETYSQVQNNGHMSEEFLLERGVRQGCPLSFPLYCVQNDVFSHDILKDKDIKGFNLPGKKGNLKLSQYADDTSFISSNFEDIPLLFEKFSKYEKATGCTLNAHKTKGLLIQTNTVARICQKYPITWCTDEFVRILGVHFNNDYQHTKYFNMQACIRQMEECAKTQSQRNLSLKGKTVVINTLILSKLWFMANVFPIPKDLIPEINKIIFGYLWKGSAAEPIARETLFLPRDRGGLGILVPLIQGQALRIKYLLQLAKQDNNNIWTYLGRYWVSSKIHNFTPHWQFLRSNVIPKNYDSYVPDCYSDILPLTKDNIKDILKKEATTKNIYRTIVDKHTNNYEIASEMKWNSIRQEILPWKCMWQNTFNSYNMPQENNIYFKILHRVLYVNQKIYDNAYNKNNLSPFCNNCKTKRETILHALYECTDKYKIWKHFFQIINKLNSAAKMTSTNCVLILNALVKDKKSKKLLLTIHITILKEIWIARNLLKHQKKSLTNDVIIRKIITKLREIIRINFQKHLRQETLETFKKNFCINEALCSVIGNDLTIHL